MCLFILFRGLSPGRPGLQLISKWTLCFPGDSFIVQSRVWFWKAIYFTGHVRLQSGENVKDSFGDITSVMSLLWKLRKVLRGKIPGFIFLGSQQLSSWIVFVRNFPFHALSGFEPKRSHCYQVSYCAQQYQTHKSQAAWTWLWMYWSEAGQLAMLALRSLFSWWKTVGCRVLPDNKTRDYVD